MKKGAIIAAVIIGVIVFAFTKNYYFDSVVIVSPDSATTQITGLNSPGVYKFELRVMDDDSVWSAPDTVSITVQPPVLLPVTFLYLKASQDGVVNRIEWATEQEFKCKFFYIEASVNGTDFYKLESVGCSGSPTQPAKYIYYHYDPPVFSYYRIKEVDVDGSVQYSTVAQVKRKVLDGARVVYGLMPSILISSERKSDCVVSIYDSGGRLVVNYQNTVNEGDSYIPIKNVISSGIYIIRVQLGSNVYALKYKK